MKKSNIINGQMFIHFNPLAMDKPRVWVKVESVELDGEEVSLFVDNEVLMLVAIGEMNIKQNGIGIRDKWFITDSYYGKCVREGKFVPIDDLREVYDICDQLGYEYPESRCPF